MPKTGDASSTHLLFIIQATAKEAAVLVIIIWIWQVRCH
jgi:hypothetical protein